MSRIEMHAVVALTDDLPEEGLVRGQVGTVVEDWAPGVYEVEFCDDNGRTYAMVALKAATDAIASPTSPSGSQRMTIQFPTLDVGAPLDPLLRVLALGRLPPSKVNPHTRQRLNQPMNAGISYKIAPKAQRLQFCEARQSLQSRVRDLRAVQAQALQPRES